MSRLIRTLLIIIIVIIGYLLFNTFTFSSTQISVTPAEVISIPGDVSQHLSKAIRIQTISHENPADFDSVQFRLFNEYMKTTYPLADSLLELTYINEFSHLYYWPGADQTLKPVIFMGHLDVVPAAAENLELWDAAPFGGEIKDGYIWGRGTIDDKISVIGNMEAVEYLLSQNYQPTRSMYFAFGHDEELGGVYGAIPIVAHLKELGVEAEYVIDEGFAISQGMIPGIDKDVALIGTAEKGFVSLTLSLDMEGGHSSMPAPETAIDVLSRAVVKLKDNPFEAEITPPVRDFIRHAGPEMTFLQKLAFANAGLLGSVIVKTYESTPSGNALVRTTTSPTIINAGVKENVIPYKASATVNFRILPGSTVEDVKERVIRLIDDERIKVTQGSFSSDPPPATSPDSFGYQVLNKTIREIFPEVITSPNLVVGATDSRHYSPLTNDILRFTPFYLNQDNIKTFHGVNERIPVSDFENAVRFYIRLIENSTSDSNG